MDTDAGVIVVGGGQAGYETAAALRSGGYTGPVTLIGAEPGVPYQRPPLSKAYLHGDPDRDAVSLRPQGWFAKHDVALRCGCRVARIDRERRVVECSDGSTHGYRHLVLATGARNRTLPVPGGDLDGVVHLRDIDESEDLSRRLAHASSVVVVGAGFIGLEVAAAARKYGAEVTVVELAERPMARAVSVPISEHFTGLHTAHGVRLRLGQGVSRVVEGAGRAAGVELADGTSVPADLVVVGVGVQADVELARDAGLELAADGCDGIVVDDHLRTSDAAIFAIGDCAAFPGGCLPGHSGSRVRLESVQNAVDQARCVAAAIAGTPQPYHAVPWFWTDQFASKLQMAGVVTGHDRTVVRGSPDEGSFSVFCYRGDELLGVESVNAARDHMAARRLLASGRPLSPLEAADPATDLKALSRLQIDSTSEPSRS